MGKVKVPSAKCHVLLIILISCLQVNPMSLHHVSKSYCWFPHISQEPDNYRTRKHRMLAIYWNNYVKKKTGSKSSKLEIEGKKVH